MDSLPDNRIREIHEKLVSIINNEGEILDPFSLRRFISFAETMEGESYRMLFMGLAYGAAGEHDRAIEFFQSAVNGGDEFIAQTYLAYLSRIFRHHFHAEEAIRLAKEMNSRTLCISARNAAYWQGDAELSMYFNRKAMHLTQHEGERRRLESEAEIMNNRFERFVSTSGLSQREVAKLVSLAAAVATAKGIRISGSEFYASPDACDAALICFTEYPTDASLCDLDIDIATAIAMDDELCMKNVTAWYRNDGVTA